MRSRPRRPSTVFLHVGAPLAGSAYLRECLGRHRRRLARQGVLYPTSHLGHDGGHLEAVLDVLGLTAPEHPPREGAWDRLAQTVRDWRRGTAVVSHELFADASLEQVERVLGSFGRAEAHVVYVARDLGRQLPIAWQEWVHNGGTLPFGSYLDKVVSREPHRSSRVFWRSHDVGRVLGRWATFVPPDRLHVVTVPPGDDATADALLWHRFGAVLGLDPLRFRVGEDRGRRLSSLVATEVLRRVNVESSSRGRAGGSALLLGELAADEGPRPALPAELAGWLAEEGERTVAAVKEGGYDVVGSLDDLLSVPTVLARSEEQTTPRLEAVASLQSRLLAAPVGPPPPRVGGTATARGRAAGTPSGYGEVTSAEALAATVAGVSSPMATGRRLET